MKILVTNLQYQTKYGVRNIFTFKTPPGVELVSYIKKDYPEAEIQTFFIEPEIAIFHIEQEWVNSAIFQKARITPSLEAYLNSSFRL